MVEEASTPTGFQGRKGEFDVCLHQVSLLTAQTKQITLYTVKKIKNLMKIFITTNFYRVN